MVANIVMANRSTLVLSLLTSICLTSRGFFSHWKCQYAVESIMFFIASWQCSDSLVMNYLSS